MQLTAFKAGALGVTGGRLVDVKRTTRGKNQNVTVRVRPAGSGEVSLTLSASPDCAGAASICTSDGRSLSSSIARMAFGPVGVSVADARVDEAAGAKARPTARAATGPAPWRTDASVLEWLEAL